MPAFHAPLDPNSHEHLDFAAFISHSLALFKPHAPLQNAVSLKDASLDLNSLEHPDCPSQLYLPFHIPPSLQNAVSLKDASLDLNSLLPEDTDYATYFGSLTAPPCSEGVQVSRGHCVVCVVKLQTLCQSVRSGAHE